MGGRIAIISFVLCLFTVAGMGQLISVRSTLERDSLMIGDQLVYTIRVEAAENVDFQLPVLKDTLSRNLEVLFPIGADTLVADHRRVVEQSYMITGFESGMQLIPSQEVKYSAGEIRDTARSMPLMIQVFEPVVDTTQAIMPIKPPINTPLTFRELLPWIALGMGGWLVITLVVALVWIYRKRRKNPEAFVLKPQEPAHVIAFRLLDTLKEEKLWERGEVKHFYTRLTDITRHYIERQYGIQAMESTSYEILQAFSRSNDDSLLDEMLEELLVMADLVKFAKEDPLPVDNQTHLNNAYIFVQKTYPLFYIENPENKNKDKNRDTESDKESGAEGESEAALEMGIVHEQAVSDETEEDHYLKEEDQGDG